MNQQNVLFRISQLLSRFKEQVVVLNANSEFSINIQAENILIPLLNTIYDYDLENVNTAVCKNFPGIDLRDRGKKTVIQVTATADLDKIRTTLNTYVENKLYDEFDTLCIFILTQKQSRYSQEKIDEITNGLFHFDSSNILDRTDLYRELNFKNDFNRIVEVCSLLETQFGDNVQERGKWELYCKGLIEYDQYIKNHYKYLNIKGFSPKINNSVVKIDLENLYVPLELQLEKSKEENIQKDDLQRVYTIEDAFSIFDKIVILGHPGSGKSTILKHLAYSIVSQRLTNLQYADLVPVLVKASDYAKFLTLNSKNLNEYIVDHIDKKYDFLFTSKLEANQLVLLVDGIDEINNSSLRHNVSERLDAFAAQYPHAKIIVSSRIIGYREIRLGGYFSHLDVQSFTNKQIEKFVLNWYLSIAVNSDNDKAQANEKATELFNSIKQNQSVMRLATNPLLVTIIALIHYQGSTLPEKRASLYDIATSTFLENWVKQRESNKRNRFDKDLLVEILAPISLYIHENYTDGLIGEKELKDKLLINYSDTNPIGLQEAKQDIKELIDFLREDAGFVFEKGISESGESLFGFVHQTFQEYFTAIEFKTLWKEGRLKNQFERYIFSPNWSEVIKLSASLFKLNEPSRLGRQFTSNFVKDILSSEDQFADMRRPLVLVLQILSEETEIDFNLVQEIIDQIFTEILSCKKDFMINDVDSRTKNVFEGLIANLLETKTYQAYLIGKIIEKITDDNNSIDLRHTLCNILMSRSHILPIQKEIFSLLHATDEIKEMIFGYRTVYPVAAIVLTEEFKASILNYINSEEFISTFEGSIPTQYSLGFESRYNGMFRPSNLEPNQSENELNEQLLSIRLLKNDKIKNKLVDYYVFSMGLGDLNNIKKYLDAVSIEHPSLNFSKIKKHIKKLEKFKSYNLNEYPVFQFGSIEIYARDSRYDKFAFVKNDKVQVLSFPFENSNFFKESDLDAAELNSFIPLVLTDIKEPDKFRLNNQKELQLFIKYYRAIHWSYTINRGAIVEVVLPYLFNANNAVDRSVLAWIKKERGLRYMKSFLGEQFDINLFKERVDKSDLEDHNKLYLLHLFGDKEHYEDLLASVVQKLNNIESGEVLKEIKNILYDALY
jgi:energy-coupling factor transporter ATP-binding protein EcfA2